MHAYQISAFSPTRDDSHKITWDIVDEYQTPDPPTGMFFKGVKLDPSVTKAGLFNFQTLKGHQWLDWYDAFSGWVLVSQHFREFLIEQVGTTHENHYQFLDINIALSSEPMPGKNYKLLNLLTHLDAVDWNKSRYDRHLNGDVRSIWDCYFIKEVVNNCRYLFRLKGYEVADGVSLQLSEAIEKQGFSGWSVTEVPFPD